MKVQVKENGGSKIIILPKVFCKYMDIKAGDWIDVADIIKVKKEAKK